MQCVHELEIYQDRKTETTCPECKKEVYAINTLPCGECLSFHAAGCRRNLMVVTADTHIRHKKGVSFFEGGQCFQLK